MYICDIKTESAGELFLVCGLSAPKNVDTTIGLFENDMLLATASLKGEMIQGVAVHPDFQGEDLTAKLLTELISRRENLYLFTKTQNTRLFEGLGFHTLATARPYAALMEYGQSAEKYRNYLLSKKGEYEGTAAAAVVNCNPFTLGHRYLIEYAAKRCKRLYVIVVEENLSEFPFEKRFEMVKRGTEDIENTVLLKSGRYAVSALTFPSYFTKESETARAGAAIDAELFSELFAPNLNIVKRFVGSEPNSEVTAIYNEALSERLPKHGIEVEVLERLRMGGESISASAVRAMLREGKIEDVRALVPKSSFDVICKN